MSSSSPSFPPNVKVAGTICPVTTGSYAHTLPSAIKMARCHACGATIVAPEILAPSVKSLLGMTARQGKSEEPDPKESGIPDSTEPVLALRHWGLNNNGQLRPPMAGVDKARKNIWHPGECIAWCQNSADSSDECKLSHCSCGFYGVWSPRHEYARNTNYDGNTVFGVMECYGRVRLGDMGLRTSKAKIVALHLPPVSRWSPNFVTIRTLMESYGAEGTKFYQQRSNLLNAYQTARPDGLLSGGFG